MDDKEKANEIEENIENQENTENQDNKEKKSRIKLSSLQYSLISICLTLILCGVLAYVYVIKLEDNYNSRISDLNNKITELESVMSESNKSNQDYIFYLETIINKSNLYYGGEIKLDFERDNQNRLFVKDISAKELSDDVITKYTKGWGEKREFELRVKDNKLVYLGPDLEK